MREKRRFIADYQTNCWTMQELCVRFGISRTTGYKWLRRFEAGGLDGLDEQSRRPHSCPHETSDEVIKLILSLKKETGWGARKLRRVLKGRHPEVLLPSRSTIFDILERHGLVRKRRSRTRWKHPGSAPLTTAAPNEVWTADFKGQFRTQDGEYCYPLTVVDNYSRMLLCCRALPNVKAKGARASFEALFREQGLPDAIRTDNGVPFASTGIHGLSKLNVWWLKLGIVHQRIEPASPQQNGAHERMHRTLKAAVCRPPAKNRSGQQQKFEAWRKRFNEVRPHEALNDETPASRYAPSKKEYPKEIPEPEYPGHFEVRRVSNAGTFRLRNKSQPFLSQALNGETIGLEEIEDGLWNVVFYDILLGRYDEETQSLTGVRRVKDVPGQM